MRQLLGRLNQFDADAVRDALCREGKVARDQLDLRLVRYADLSETARQLLRAFRAHPYDLHPAKVWFCQAGLSIEDKAQNKRAYRALGELRAMGKPTRAALIRKTEDAFGLIYLPIDVP